MKVSKCEFVNRALFDFVLNDISQIQNKQKFVKIEILRRNLDVGRIPATRWFRTNPVGPQPEKFTLKTYSRYS